jgi:hypothetical protein
MLAAMMITGESTMNAPLGRPARVLLTLRDAESERPCSIARLRTLCDCPMSELMRDLALLAQGGWIVLDHDAAGNASATLADEGRLLCDALAASSAA